ncbi:hypothetical protein PCASD_24994 [Puccinia coronata f. sp. avenae]|uniref:Uncharacterized protein n=1 Tax=Puccinia coronata f. sp. avenae TaxID=200324 RepID=A0A2N5TJ06_9BASI|nr:hypothetical protein PCASD_24994 [Puccinia coronata f. sp. avenae]
MFDKLKPPSVGYQKGDSNKTSSLSDLELENEHLNHSADPVGKQSGFQIRQMIQSSSPAESGDNDADERVTGKQPRHSKVLPTPSLSSAPKPSSSRAMEVIDSPVGNEKLKRLEPVLAKMPPCAPFLSGRICRISPRSMRSNGKPKVNLTKLAQIAKSASAVLSYSLRASKIMFDPSISNLIIDILT